MSELKWPDPNRGDDKSPYWICDVCATMRGGVYFKMASTCSALKCGYCDGELQIEEFIYPTVDYLWPSQVAKHPDGGRRSAERIAKQIADSRCNVYERSDDFPTKEQVQKIREETPAWSETYRKEFNRIQSLWGFK